MRFTYGTKRVAEVRGSLKMFLKLSQKEKIEWFNLGSIRVVVKQQGNHGSKRKVRENGETKSLCGTLGSGSEGLGKPGLLHQGWVRCQGREAHWSACENHDLYHKLSNKQFLSKSWFKNVLTILGDKTNLE